MVARRVGGGRQPQRRRHRAGRRMGHASRRGIRGRTESCSAAPCSTADAMTPLKWTSPMSSRQVMQLRSPRSKRRKPEPPTHRTDATFVFVAASTAGTARLILPQLKYNYSGDVPVYSTSDSFEPDPSANSDIEGMLFPDMPWMISNDPVTAQIRDSVRAAWPARTARRDRLVCVWVRCLSPGARAAIEQRRPARSNSPG